MVEFKVSENESYFFDEIDSSLMLVHGKERSMISSRQRALATYNVEIVKDCIPKFKEFINLKAEEEKPLPFFIVGPRFLLSNCKTKIGDTDHTYVFRRIEGEEREIIEAIVVYWIVQGALIDVNSVEIDAIAIPSMIKYVNENF